MSRSTQACAILGPWLPALLSIVVFVTGFCAMYRHNKWLAAEDWKMGGKIGRTGNGATGAKVLVVEGAK